MEINIEGLPIHYREIGTGSPILMIHGWDSNAGFMSYRWERAVQWPEQTRRVYVDLPGHGRTPGSEMIRSTDDMLRIIHTFAKEVFSEEHYLLLGLSYGAYIARGLVYHSANRIDGVCMLVPLIIADDSKRSLVPREQVEVDPSLLSLFTEENREIFDLLAVQDEQTLREWAALIEIVSEHRGDVAFREEFRADPSRYSLSFDIDAIPSPYRRPSLIVTGRQDNKVGYEDAWSIVEAYPRATFIILDRTGHLLDNQDHNVAQLIQDWLYRVQKYEEGPA